MALTTTRELRWDAPGAPTLNANAGSFRNLARDFLEDCGWSVIWQDAGAQKVVLRNSMAHGGSGCYIRILDDGSFSGSTRVARIDSYEDMSDIDTGTGLASGGWVWKDRTGSGGPNAYTLHADERTCYLTTYVAGDTPPTGSGVTAAYHTHMSGFGDFSPANAGDPGVFCASGADESPGTSTTTTSPSALCRNNGSAAGISTAFHVSRNSALAQSSTAAVLLNPAPSNNTNLGIGSNGSSLIDSATEASGTGIHVLPALVLAGGYLYGRMRGLFVPMNRCDTASNMSVGETRSPLGTSDVHSLAVLAGQGGSGSGITSLSRLFVERIRSWDDV